MIPIICPNCRGTGKVRHQPPPVQLTNLQRRVYEIVSTTTDGIALPDLVSQAYATKLKGAPLTAKNSILVTIAKANQRLAAANLRIASSKGHGAIYRIKHLNPAAQ